MEKPRAKTAVSDCSLTLPMSNDKFGASLLKRSKNVTTVVAGLVAVIAAFVVASVVNTQAAYAGCGGVQHFSAQKRIHGTAPPLAIGDSVMLGAAHNLARAGFEVNVRGCRQWSEGLGVLRTLLPSHRSTHLVVIALGSNWRVDAKDIREALRIIGPKRRLALVIPRKDRGAVGSDGQTIRAAARRHPGRIKVLDWPGYSAGKGFFDGDGLHLGSAGAAGFTRLLSQSMRYARELKMTNVWVRAINSPRNAPAPTPTSGQAVTPANRQGEWRIKVKWSGYLDRPTVALRGFKVKRIIVNRKAQSVIAVVTGSVAGGKARVALIEQAKREGGPHRIDTKTVVLPKCA